jgi:hypothetical protein
MRTKTPVHGRLWYPFAFGAVALVALAAIAGAQVVLVPPEPQIGSSNPITAAPPVPRPHTRPCVVQLFSNLAFANYTPKVFDYTPPASCPGPWAKVVFTADFTVSAGNQYDRTAAFYLGHANIYYGSTAEPRAALSPSWHVERDVTDLTAIFKSAQSGEANIGNFVGVYNGVTYNGIIYANAALQFYPESQSQHAPRTPDVVVAVNGSGGDAGTLNTTASNITQTVTLPVNTERVYLDVIAQNQSNDEFFYFCVPNNQMNNLESCGNTPFRETEVTIDGQAAGVAPVYPWIFTGGIDEFLWEPIPGVQALDFRPYRVDLTPFAGILADGNPHVIAVSVFNADSYFLATANLLAYTDHGAARITGGLISSTLSAAPSPVVEENITSSPNGPTYTGTITVSSQRDFAISGYVDTSHGRVLTTVQQRIDFVNTQEFDVSPTTDIQNVQQNTSVDSHTTTQDGWRTEEHAVHFSYPLEIKYSYLISAEGAVTQATSVEQRDLVRDSGGGPFGAQPWSLDNTVHSTDTQKYDASGNFLGPFGAATTQTYRVRFGNGECYSRTLDAQSQKLTAVHDGAGCESPGR